jgi:hypothetical protein
LSFSIRCKRSAQTLLVLFLRTIYAQKPSPSQNCSYSLLIFSTSAIIATVKRKTRFLIFSTFASDFDYVGRPGRLSSYLLPFHQKPVYTIKSAYSWHSIFSIHLIQYFEVFWRILFSY